jgi:uncharacterized phage protein (TIGR01671 family)
MREIKFRAWEVNKVLGGRMSETFTLFDIHNNGLGSYGDTYTLMQFTGLKDKNRKDIYEGDVVKFDADYIKPMVVYWNNEMTGFYPLISERPNRITVIGNIYENPELIK